MVTRRTRHHNLRTDARSCAYCSHGLRPHGQRIRELREHPYLPGKDLGESCHENTMTAEGDDDAARQRTSCPKPRSVVDDVVPCSALRTRPKAKRTRDEDDGP